VVFWFCALAGWVAAIGLAGCTIAPAPAPPAHASSHAATPGTTSASPPPSSGTPQQRAVADADLMLKAFVPPPGARKVSGSPVPGSVLSRSPAVLTLTDDDVVTETTWWLAPGDPQQVLAWEMAHIPTLYESYGRGITAAGVWNDVFRIPAVPGLFDTRELAVSTTSAGHGKAAIRVDSLVGWIPVRPSGDTVPATARVAKLVETRFGFGGTPPRQSTTVMATATVTNPAQVAALAAYLNDLAVNPPGGVSSCPMPSGGLTVTFSAQPAGRALAAASATLGGCDFLGYTMPGQAAIALGGGPAGENLLDEVNHVTGLDWKTPPSTL
jgi:hypothetical protein